MPKWRERPQFHLVMIAVDAIMTAFRVTISLLAVLSAIALTAMMLITCSDIVLRLSPTPFKGAIDLVQILAAVAIAGALPYTTALKGHVAIEYFSRQLPKSIQLAVDSVMRALCVALFAFCTYGCIDYGIRLKATGQVSTTIQLPIFWIPWFIAITFALTALVILYHLIRPSKALLS